MTAVPTGSWPDMHPDRDVPLIPRLRHLHPLTERGLAWNAVLLVVSVLLAAAGIAWLGAGHSGTDIDQAGQHAVAPAAAPLGRHA